MNWSRRWARNGKAAVDALVQFCFRCPLLSCAALFTAGVVCGYRLAVWQTAVGAAALCATVAVAANGRPRAGVAVALAFLLGAGCSMRDRWGRDRDAAVLSHAAGRQTFVCRVGPDVAVTPTRGAASRCVFFAENVRIEGVGRPVRHLPMQVLWFGGREVAPQPGETWRVTGRAVVRAGRDRLPMLFVSTGQGSAKRLAASDPGAWAVRIDRARCDAMRRVTIGIENWGVVPSLNAAMLLGSRSEIPADMRRVFANSGTIHVFAISGMNIALVAGLLIVVVSALGVPRPYWVVGLAPLLFFYTFASGAQPSAMRACLMAVLYFAAPLLGRRPSGSAALAGTALAVYAWTPALVFNIGCTLSFAVMGGLLAFCTPFCRYGRELCRVPTLKQNARLYEQAGRPAAGLRLRWAAWGVSLLVDSMAVSVAAWLASLPLTAYYFGRFTPGGVVANLVIAPCAFLVMVAGCLGWAASFVSAWCAAAFNHAAGFFTVIMVWTAEVTAACPWGNFNVSKWAPWQVGAWFLALAALALWLHTRRPADGLAWLETEDR